MKKTIICLTAVLIFCMGLVSATTFGTKIELELTGLTSISQIDNSDGVSVKISIHNAAGGLVQSMDAVAGIYTVGMVIPMTGSEFSLSYATDYTYNLSTIHGEFLYDFTTPADPSAGGVELHTGQTASYETGDDASVDNTAKSYIFGGSGIRTDTHTGLMWLQADGGTTTRTWSDSIDYCNNNLTGGYTDWRLPTLVELVTMFDYGRSDYQNGALSWSTPSRFYWSSTTTRFVDKAFVVGASVGAGAMGVYPKSYDSFYLRCVRSN